MKKTGLLFILLFLCHHLLSQESRPPSEVWFHTYDESGKNAINDLIQNSQGQIVAVGYSNANPHGRTDMYFLGIGQGGTRIFKNDHIGSTARDEANAVIETLDGGYTKGFLKQEQAFAWKLEGPSPSPSSIPATYSVSNKRLVFPLNKSLLELNDRAYYQFYLRNESNQNATHITARVDCDCKRGVSYYNRIELGHLKGGEGKWLSIPVWAENSLQDGENVFTVTLTDANGSQIPGLSFDLNSRREAKPQLSLIHHEFSFPGKKAVRGDTVSIQVIVKNTGDKTAEEVVVNFNYQWKVEGLSKKKIKLGDLPPGESRQVSFRVKTYQTFLEDFLEITCSARERSSFHGDIETFKLAMNEKQVEQPKTLGKLLISWLSPDPTEYPEQIVMAKEPGYTISVKAWSSTPLKKEDFEVLYLDRTAPQGRKLRNRSLKENIDQTPNREITYSYTYKETIYLVEGSNQIAVKVENEAGKEQTPPLTIIYNGERPNLWLLSIGVPDKHYELQFTTTDATDFFNLFDRQKRNPDRFFENLFGELKISEEETGKVEIEKTLESYISRENIRPNDIFVLFMSTHGALDQFGRLFLFPSDFIDGSVRSTGLYYKEDIVDLYLKYFPCDRFFVFIDACRASAEASKSRSAKSGESNFDKDSPPPPPENDKIRTFLAAKTGQFSWEDEKWQNGAGIISGDDPNTTPDGTIVITNLFEGDNWNISLTGPDCDLVSTGVVRTTNCEPCGVELSNLNLFCPFSNNPGGGNDEVLLEISYLGADSYLRLSTPIS